MKRVDKFICKRCQSEFTRIARGKTYDYCSRVCANRRDQELKPNHYYDDRRAMEMAAHERELARQDRHGRELAKRDRLRLEIQQIRWSP